MRVDSSSRTWERNYHLYGLFYFTAFICAFIKKLVFVSYFIILKQTFAYIVYLNTVRCLPGLTDPQF